MADLIGSAQMETRSYECRDAAELEALQAALAMDGWQVVESSRQSVPPYTVSAIFVKTEGQGDYWLPD